MEMTLAELANHVAEHLPEDWELSLSLRLGEYDITLTNPDGENVEGSYCCDSPLEEQIIEAVRFARRVAGLESV